MCTFYREIPQQQKTFPTKPLDYIRNKRFFSKTDSQPAWKHYLQNTFFQSLKAPLHTSLLKRIHNEFLVFVCNKQFECFCFVLFCFLRKDGGLLTCLKHYYFTEQNFFSSLILWDSTWIDVIKVKIIVKKNNPYVESNRSLVAISLRWSVK